MPNAARGALRPTLTARTRVCSQLDTYLRALLAYPAIALSPLVCTFLDAVDCHSFRAQMLPALEQQYRMEQLQQGGELPPISDEVHFGQPAAPMVERAPKSMENQCQHDFKVRST